MCSAPSSLVNDTFTSSMVKLPSWQTAVNKYHQSVDLISDTGSFYSCDSNLSYVQIYGYWQSDILLNKDIEGSTYHSCSDVSSVKPHDGEVNHESTRLDRETSNCVVESKSKVNKILGQTGPDNEKQNSLTHLITSPEKPENSTPGNNSLFRKSDSVVKRNQSENSDIATKSNISSKCCRKRRKSLLKSCINSEEERESSYCPVGSGNINIYSTTVAENIYATVSEHEYVRNSRSPVGDNCEQNPTNPLSVQNDKIPLDIPVGVKLRKAKCAVGKELRKTFRTVSMIISSPGSQQNINCSPSYRQFESKLEISVEGSKSDIFSTNIPRLRRSQRAVKARSVSFPWRRDPLDSSQKRWSKIDGCTQDSHVYLPNGVAIPDDAPFFISQNCPAVEASSIASCSISNASPSGSCREQNVRRSSAFSRSSISQSEWDIRRPWSAIEPGGSSLSQSAFRLAELTGGCVESQSHGTSVVTRNEAPLSMPYQTNANHAHQNSPEGMFQKFKKSLSLRLNKKTSRCESPSLEMSLCSLPVEGQVTITDEIPTVVTSPSKIQVKEEESKSSYFKFGHPIFRSSKERRKAKLKDVRSSKCSSGDSGDSGIEIVSRTSTLTEETSSKEEEANSEIISSYLENNNITEDESSNNSSTVSNNGDKGVRRAHSDMSTRPTSKLLSCSEFAHRQSLGRQYSSPQPIKLRPHHRLPNYNSANSFQANRRPNRGSTHMRRSVSQPLDLDKSFQAQVSLHKMRSSDEEPAKRRQRRPSVDNLLNDDNTSEEGASDCEDVKPEIKFSLDEEASFIVYAEALWDHVSLDSDELVFKAGDQITVIDSSDKDWWWGRISLRSGWFPASFVRLLVNQEDHQTEPDGSDITSDWASPTLSVSSLSQDQIRSNVINEILSTERDYVKHLRDVVEGYMKQVHKRPDMFNEESVVTIFGNIETLFSFHTQFLAELEKCFVCEEPHLSCIGECFIQNKLGFEIYSEYCNNHPSAVSELQQLYQDQKYIHFFEACRLLQEMIDISLDGFLLTPVQKICKYPLQLQELLKYTQPSHPDFTSVLGAMQAMREVALLVNERRRRMECLEKIATWQKTVEGWEGSDLLDDSSQLIYQGEVIKGGGTSWPKEVSLFLFDHQLVYCKRDLLKRNTYVYRGRINTDLCEVIDINWDPTRNSTLQNSWKILCLHKNKTYIFACKTCEDKTKWLASFKKERELVAIDEASGFVASEKQKQAARLAARNHKNKPKKPKTVKSHKRTQAMTYAQAKLLVNDGDLGPNSLSLRSAQESRKKGLWFSFGGHKKSRSSGRSSKQNSLTNP